MRSAGLEVASRCRLGSHRCWGAEREVDRDYEVGLEADLGDSVLQQASVGFEPEAKLLVHAVKDASEDFDDNSPCVVVDALDVGRERRVDSGPCVIESGVDVCDPQIPFSDRRFDFGVDRFEAEVDLLANDVDAQEGHAFEEIDELRLVFRGLSSFNATDEVTDGHLYDTADLLHLFDRVAFLADYAEDAHENLLLCSAEKKPH